MTDEEINIAIAEACGWHDLSIVDGTACGLKQKVTSLNGRYEPIPDYCNDLNAMHKAEFALELKDYELYRWKLWDLVKRPLVSEWFRAYLSATAHQRAEALLKTLNIWKA